jgi:hypothetical protein
MENKDKYYKETIKSRMSKNASDIWGVRSIDNLDPLIKLLVEALASEINKLSSEINNIETRLLERIAHLLTPDILMSVRPAHMILHAQPTEEQMAVDKSSDFIVDGDQLQRGISFYPAGIFSITAGEVRSLVCAQKIFRVEKDRRKYIHARTLARSEKFTNNLWIGLDISPSITRVKNLSFYFDLPNMENKNELLHLLPYTLWSFEGSMLSINPGIHREEEKDDFSNMHLFACDLTNMPDESILEIYNHQFVTVTGEIQNTRETRKILPDELREMFADEARNQALPALLWIKVTFPPNFEDYIMEDFYVSINAFPVINKELYSIHHKTVKWTSVIPLNTRDHEFILSVKSVSDSNNNKYAQLPFKEDNSPSISGTYIVKRGGAERFDSRDAREYISNLIDIVREENASFAMLGNGFVDEFVSKINDQILLIQNKLSTVGASNKDLTSYMVIDAGDVGETMYVDYWVTNGEYANNIKSGKKLRSTNAGIKADTIISLTPSRGGRKSQTQAMDTYKYILTSRDRIYTDEDIVNFCFACLGDVITSASVKKGVYASPRPKEGLIRSIDVFITLKSHLVHFSSGQEIADRFLNLLKEKSPETYNYRVFILNQS